MFIFFDKSFDILTFSSQIKLLISGEQNLFSPTSSDFFIKGKQLIIFLNFLLLPYAEAAYKQFSILKISSMYFGDIFLLYFYCYNYRINFSNQGSHIQR